MTTPSSQLKISGTRLKTSETMVDSVRILSDMTRRDIEKSYNLDTIRGTEAYYSGRYGWTLRRSID
ncbi:MAG: hypothetical protein CFH11_00522 [Alphaproteobacteria bacterium MarineAlpha5_Bin1]|jgi:hypothetical protein|nr:MAG: hypothetical protein CFH11_00522 [Alphaproteobacteria bacterium MarineAlpha5_Bin1]|tara:strand:- start:146 stop:343 length:198 start_codon:yes stop_codon:yes gene_type:complete